ncbi:MAG: DUF5694 domain-containing protein [Pyrinomonadaceae bacterium]
MLRQLTKYLFPVLFVLGIFLSSALAQQQTKAQVMILGVYHFANPNLDLVKGNLPDHLSDKKQKEIAELLDLLAKFKPTKIVVEAEPENTKIQDHYAEYLKGNYKLTAAETQQIGFRLAKRFDLKQLYLADNQIPMDFDALMAAAVETKNTQFLEMFPKEMAQIEAMKKHQAEISVREALTELNEPLLQEKTKALYLQLARVRGKDKFVGADVLAAWYQRNFRIFTNLAQTINSSEDRVLVVFGQGHIPYLRDAVKSSPDMQLIEPNDYLKINEKR